MADDETRYRVVDRDTQGWPAIGMSTGSAMIYSADYGAGEARN